MLHGARSPPLHVHVLPPAPLALQGWCFGVMGQRLATRIRILILRALLRQVRAGGGDTMAVALY